MRRKYTQSSSVHIITAEAEKQRRARVGAGAHAGPTFCSVLLYNVLSDCTGHGDKICVLQKNCFIHLYFFS
jgi:hypothetical protein